jgi:dephospho-CoA kinase
MHTIGLTGGIGMGKSAAAERLRARGIRVVDTDGVAREVVEPGQPAVEQIKTVFGPGMVDADGRLKREAMARLVFADASARQQLEAILHPAIHAVWRRQVEAWRAAGERLAVVVIPLLFEAPTADRFDLTVCVACTPFTQQERLRERGWSPEQIQQRLHAQLPIEQKMALANRVVWSEGALDVLDEQLDRILRRVSD